MPKDQKFSFTMSRGDGSEQPLEVVEIEGVNPYREQLLDLCNALTTGHPPLLTPDESVSNMRAIDAVHESARTGEPINIGA